MNTQIDTLDIPTSGSRFARGLSIMLAVTAVFLGLVVLGMSIFGISMFVGGAPHDMVYAELENADALISPRKFGFAFLGGAIITAAWVYVLYLLRLIVGTLIKGDPFVPSNISRLRKIWIALAVTELMRMFMYALMAPALISIGASGSAVNTAADSGEISIRIGSWFLVFVIAALAEVFRHGALLRRDQELTV
jgi:hypothetical protein